MKNLLLLFSLFFYKNTFGQENDKKQQVNYQDYSWKENYHEVSDNISENRRAVTDNDGNQGFVNSEGHLVIPCNFSFDNDAKFVDGILKVYVINKEDVLYGVIDTLGKYIFEPKYYFIDITAKLIVCQESPDKEVQIFSKDTFKFIASYEVVYTSPIYSSLSSEPNEGFFWNNYLVSKDTLFGAIDKYGNQTIDFLYQNPFEFIDGLASVQNISGKFGFIDLKGNTIVPFIYDSGGNFPESGIIEANKDGKWGQINKKGEVIKPFIYHSRSLNGVITSSKITETWENNYTIVYENIFENRRAVIDKYGKLGFVNGKGELVVPCKFTNNEEPKFIDGILIVSLKEKGLLGVVDTLGKFVIEPKYGSIITTSKLLLCYPASLNQLHDSSGSKPYEIKVFKKENYKYISSFSEFDYRDEIKDYNSDYYCVQKNKLFGAIDKNGKAIIGFLYYDSFRFTENLALIENNLGKFGFINKSGKMVIPAIYDGGIQFFDGLAAVYKKNKWGQIDLKGVITKPFIYDSWEDAMGFKSKI